MINFSLSRFGLRFFFIVLTDSTCWGPIIVLKILAFMDVDLPSEILAWLIVFVLPFNSAVNPLLYTFSTPKYRDQIYTTVNSKSFSKKHDSNSNQGSSAKKSPFRPVFLCLLCFQPPPTIPMSELCHLFATRPAVTAQLRTRSEVLTPTKSFRQFFRQKILRRGCS
jgi:hypothetical protein